MSNRNKYGGGSQTNINGLTFEQKTSLEECLKNTENIKIKSKNEVWFKDELYGVILPKNQLYKWFKEEYGVLINNGLSKKFIPDNAFYNIVDETLYIVEVKYQTTSGSVDEKLQTFQFKIYQYERMMKNVKEKTGKIINVKYIYVLNDWFKKEVYRDNLEYILLKNSKYYFNSIPLKAIGIK